MSKYIVSNIKLSIEQDISEIKNIISRKFHIEQKYISKYRILKESIDARKKNEIMFVYTASVEINGNPSFRNSADIKKYQPKTGTNISKPYLKLTNRPIIVGTGPAGLFAGLILAEKGYNPIIIERGSAIEKRIRHVNDFWIKGIFNKNTNVQFGEGGAGTFSDGKLTTRISDERCEFVLKELVKLGASPDILYKAKPHIGSDSLRGIILKMRAEIESKGGEFLFDTKLTDIISKDGKLHKIEINNNEEIAAEAMILAPGHSARDTFEMLVKRGIKLEPKAFSMGMRIEHLQRDIDEERFGKYANHPKLGRGEYALFEKLKDRTVYTFCMCPGGQVVAAASEEDTIVTNGMSLYKRDKTNSNSALVCSITPKDFGLNPLDGIHFQRMWERKAFEFSGDYSAPIQRLGDFINDTGKLSEPTLIKPSYTGNTILGDLNRCLPDYITGSIKEAIPALDKRLKGFYRDEAILTGVETRTSSPVRIKRGTTFESETLNGLFPAGEGAGYAGGIMSAAVDGIKAAEGLMSIYINKN